MVYVYAVCDSSPAGLDAVRGIGERRPSARGHAGVAAVFSETERGATPPTAENVWRHEQVVERLMGDQAVLPARFGTVLADTGALDEVLAHNLDRLTEALNRVRGCVELGVRVLAPPKQATAATHDVATGRSYLQSRLEADRARRHDEAQAAGVASRLHEQLRAGARDGTMRVLPSPQFLMTGAYLVPRRRAENFRRRVVDAGRVDPALRLLCTGPWPPYHFVPKLDLSARAEAHHA
jgi:hypothetical protein